LDHLLRAATEELVRRAVPAVAAIRAGDSRGLVDRLIEQQMRAEERFRLEGYAVWDEFPIHPAAGALARYDRALSGQICDPRWLTGLATLADLLAQHSDDWSGYEELLGSKLRNPRDFITWFWELETSAILRSEGHSTEWQSLKRPDAADLLCDEVLDVECTLIAAETGGMFPFRFETTLVSDLLKTMKSADRALHVELHIGSRLTGPQGQMLRREIHGAIRSGATGSVASTVSGVAATIQELAVDDHPLTPERMAALQGPLPFSSPRWGHLAMADGQRVHPRFVTINLPPLALIKAAASRGAEKHSQALRRASGRPTVVAIKFGRPVDINQARDPQLSGAVRQIVVQEMRNATELSGVLWAFDAALTFPPAGRGIVDPLPGFPGPWWSYSLMRNPVGRLNLPDSFRLIGSPEEQSTKEDS
jgi:hypothetical protein